MNRKALPVLFLIFMISSVAGLHSQNHTLQVEGEVGESEINLYPEQRTVEFPALKSGDEVVEYSNASYEEYVSWQADDKGVEEIRSGIESQINLEGVRTGSSAESIEVTYIENESLDRNFSYQELKDLVPSKVEASYEIGNEAVNTTIDVELEKREDSPVQDDISYSDARGRAKESFGSSPGESYKATFEILNTTQGEHTGEPIRNVSKSQNSINFTGRIELGQPCDKINKTYEQKNNELVLNIDTYSTGEPCIDIIAFKKYSFNLKSDEPVILEVRHSGQEVRTIETVEPHRDEAGIVAEIVKLLQNIL